MFKPGHKTADVIKFYTRVNSNMPEVLRNEAGSREAEQGRFKFIEGYKISEKGRHVEITQRIVIDGNLVWQRAYQGDVIEPSLTEAEIKEIGELSRRIRNTNGETRYRYVEQAEGDYLYQSEPDSYFPRSSPELSAGKDILNFKIGGVITRTSDTRGVFVFTDVAGYLEREK